MEDDFNCWRGANALVFYEKIRQRWRQAKRKKKEKINLKNFIAKLAAFISLLFIIFLIKTSPVYAQENPSNSSVNNVNVFAQVLPSLSVDLDYPKDGSFYSLSLDQKLKISGFSNILNPLIQFNFQEIRIKDIKYDFQFFPNEYGNWQWQTSFKPGPGIYRLNIIAENSLDNDNLRAERNVYLLIDDPTNPVLSQSYDLDALYLIREEAKFVDQFTVTGENIAIFDYQQNLHIKNTEGYLKIIDDDS